MIKIAMEEVIIEWRFHICVYIYNMNMKIVIIS